MVPQQIVEAPRAVRLEHPNVVPARDQLAQHAAQKMGIAVVPAGPQRVGEIDDLHAAPAIVCDADA